MTTLSVPPPGRAAAEAFVAEQLGHLSADDGRGSAGITGGQTAADTALAAFDVSGYARARSIVDPMHRRGASRLSPYIRHGLLQLGRVWHHVAGGPPRDVAKFRDELLWQEYARHWYALLGARTSVGVRHEQAAPTSGGHWDRSMACVDSTVTELERDGWLVNQARMWLASQWAVRDGHSWRDGEDTFFRHLLDGSRAANRLGWQWTTGVGSSKAYGFSRWQVEKRAPALCRRCPHAAACPIQEWPDDPPLVTTPEPTGTAALRGPLTTTAAEEPDTVWITAESLGDSDPALTANPDLPVIFVFDEPLLARLRLASKRLVFLTETLTELASKRDVDLRLGDPTTELRGRKLAVTHAPVPGFGTRARELDIVETHPWPWLALPTARSVRSFSAWRRSAEPTVEVDGGS